MILEQVSKRPLTRRRLVGLTLGAGVASLLTSCAPAATPVATAPPVTKEREKVVMRLDWFPGGYHTPFFVALDKGWYAERGLDVEIGESKGSGQAAQFVGSGNATFGSVEAGAVVKAVGSGLPVKSVFLSFAKSALGYTFPKDLNIKTPKDLEGKIYAAVSFGATFQLWPAFVAANGIDAKKVTILNVDPDNNVQVVASGNAHFLDGALGLEEYLLGEAGRPAETFLMNDYGLNYPGHAVVANTSTIQQKPELVRRFVEATAAGFDFAKSKQDESLEILLKRNPDIKRGLGGSEYKAAIPLWSNPSGAQTEQQWQSAVELVAKFMQLKRTPTTAEVYTAEFLPKR